MTALSTAGWVAHDLAIATGVGGALFGRFALEPAIGDISDEEERGQVLNHAWRKFGNVQLFALGTVASTWFFGRSYLSGREVSRVSRGVVLAKDAFVVGALVSAIANAIAGRRMAASAPGGAVPMQDASRPSPHAPTEAKRLKPVVDGIGVFNTLCCAGVLVTTTILAMEGSKSLRFSALSRLLK